jgi:hypothetical protein
MGMQAISTIQHRRNRNKFWGSRLKIGEIAFEVTGNKFAISVSFAYDGKGPAGFTPVPSLPLPMKIIPWNLRLGH